MSAFNSPEDLLFFSELAGAGTYHLLTHDCSECFLYLSIPAFSVTSFEMQKLKFIQQDPTVSSYTARISDVDWSFYENIIRD